MRSSEHRAWIVAYCLIVGGLFIAMLWSVRMRLVCQHSPRAEMGSDCTIPHQPHAVGGALCSALGTHAVSSAHTSLHESTIDCASILGEACIDEDRSCLDACISRPNAVGSRVATSNTGAYSPHLGSIHNRPELPGSEGRSMVPRSFSEVLEYWCVLPQVSRHCIILRQMQGSLTPLPYAWSRA